MTFIFRLEADLEIECGVLPLHQYFFNARESAARSSGACGDGFLGAMEIVPGQRLHVGPEDEVGVAFPDFQLVLLRGAHSAADHLKNVGGGAAVAVLHADGDADNHGGTQVASGARRNGGDQATISKTTRADLDRLEQSRKSATGADGVHKVSLREYHRFARGEVRGHHRKGNAEVFKAARIENAFDQVLKALIACQAESRDAPTGDVAEAERAASINDARKWRAAGVGGAQDAAHAGSRDVRDGDVILLEDLQDAQMGESARETSAEGEADACPAGHTGCTFVQGLAGSVPVPRHTGRMSGRTTSSYGASVLK